MLRLCYAVILSKKQAQLILVKLPYLRKVRRRKLPDPSLNRICNALSIDVQYTLSFQWINFGLKCLRGKLREGLNLVAMTTI